MFYKPREDYQIEDFVTDESFTNYHFKLNVTDEASWKAWLELHPEKQWVVKQAQELIETLSITLSEEEYQAELGKIQKTISGAAQLQGTPLFQYNPFKAIRNKRILQFAAIAAAIIISTGYVWHYTSRTAPDRLAQTVNEGNIAMTLILSDSTIVTLASQATLQYPMPFQKNKRQVYLKGEARFQVKRNEKAPFQVYSENMVATVLGTTFDFKKAGDSAIVVELLDGKLHVQITEGTGKGQFLMLNLNEKAVYMKQTHVFYKKAMPVQSDIAFRKNNFDEIAAKIKNTFGITVINKSGKKAWRFTGTFENATAEDVVNTICLVKNLTVAINKDTIYIK